MRHRTAGFLIGLALTTACGAGPAEPAPAFSLLGDWIAAPGPGQFEGASLSVRAAVFDTNYLAGTIRLTGPVAGAPYTAMTGVVTVAAPGTTTFEFELREDSARENCAYDYIDPTEPLCRLYGEATFSGALAADGTLTGTIGTTNCTKYSPVLQCERVTLDGPVVFRRK